MVEGTVLMKKANDTLRTEKAKAVDEELRALWRERASLDETGWVRLYQLVVAALTPYRPRELAGLRGEHGDYVQDFFHDKVYRLDSHTDCRHVGALRSFYRNFLRDQLDSEQQCKRHKPGSTNRGDEEEAAAAAFDFAAAEQAPDVVALLQEVGLTPEQVETAALSWLQGNESWVMLFVALSNCPDAEASEPLVHLARRMHIKSQAYKAAKLGFNWGRQTPAGFENTLLGQWLTSLGLKISLEHAEQIHAALKILCFVALTWADQQEFE